ncbi:MAG: xanthine dehydrogenase family protein molybdopterin-binding subunit [Cyclobacteriaceae bacterium]|nr:xanthine dehydrogenase family protein molybdopterin-binding subunit [Cyclobacteriaceae bacterium]
MEEKKLKLPYGIPGHNLTEIERVVPADEPPAWPINDKLKVVGKSVRRTDALAKVTGAAKYTADIQLSGMLIGKFLRAPHPNATIRSIDTSAAERHPGVYGVHVITHHKHDGDESGPGEFPEIKYAGQPVAGVAAVDMPTAIEAVKLIKVIYDTKPFVVDLEEAQKPESPLVYDAPVDQQETDGGGGSESGLGLNGNVRGPSRGGGPRGDLEKGFAGADIILENTYRTQVHTHSSLETHGCVVDWKPDNITIYASTQSTKGVRNEFANHFNLNKSQVRVICEFMGGGFGSKHSAGDFGLMAGHLSKKTGRPVKLMLDRQEEHISGGNRPNSIQYYKLGAKKNGELVAMYQRSHGTGGVSLGAGVGHIAEAMYTCPNFTTEQYDVLTHASPGAAWRAPGNVQGAFGLESLIDELAEKLGMDPLKLRDKIDPSEIRKVERKRGAEKFNWARRKKANSDTGTVKKGLGMAQGHWPRIVHIDSTAEVRAYRDGGVEVRSSVQDIGTGTKTIMAQVVAEELGLQAEDITVSIGDTAFPDGPSSGGSIATGSITPAARSAAYQLKLKLFDQVAKNLGADASDLVAENGQIVSKKDAAKKVPFKEALRKMRYEQISASGSRADDYEGFAYGTIAHGELGSVQFAEVSVDTETGFIQVDKIVAAHSCGRPLNPKQIESQINGGVIQGIAYALYEDRIMDKATGQQVNKNLHQYKLPMSFETPEIENIIVEEYPARSNTDAYGIGEPANISTAVAVANAVYNAIGVRIKELPITPAKVLAALNKA